MSVDEKVNPRRLKGFQDYPPEIMAKRLAIMQAARELAHISGYHEIATPALEYSEVLLGVGGETDKQIFRFMDGGERDVALRYDLTVPFARYVAENFGNLALPFKRLQIGDVWRAEKPQKGRYREFCQCDFDIIGADTLGADVEILHTFYEVLDKVVPSSFTISCNHRKILSYVVRKILGLKEKTEEDQALIILDKLSKQGKDSVLAIFGESLGVPEARGRELLDLISSFRQDDANSLLEILDDETKLVWQRFRETLSIAQDLSQGRGKLAIDLSVARGLAYYTGIVFETTVDDAMGFGSICSGGRYDNLAERFINQALPGVGASIGVDRLVALLLDKAGELKKTSTQVFLAIATEDALRYAFQTVGRLRKLGISSELALKGQKIAHQFKQADKRGYPWVVTVGTEEVSTQTYTLRNMAAGTEEKSVSWDQMLTKVRA